MRWVTYQLAESDVHRVGLIEDGAVYGAAPGTRLVDVISRGVAGTAVAGEEIRRAPVDVYPLDEVRLLAPIPAPPSIRDFSVFVDHVATGIRNSTGRELDPGFFEQPVFWYCNPTTVVGTGTVVEVPGNEERMDYELGVAAVIGARGRDIEPARAEEHIAGFCIMNDWSARDLQAREMQIAPIGPSKGKDFATGLGPFLVTPDELEGRRAGRSYDLSMTAAVNGREYSRGCLADMYWSFAEMVAYASRAVTLLPGDVLCSGSVGMGCIGELILRHGADRYSWLAEGDEVTLAVDGMGELRNRITWGPPPHALR